ncbi:MAG TPA: hypothetical protein VFL66_02340, partial [Gaiellaceae bacterium]|nr:hypothetical protein [Gaiellaceae bacterium]
MRSLRPGILLPVVAADLAVALLRQAQGGTRSGYAPLLVLPAVWIAFVAGRRGVAFVVATTALAL